MAAPRSTVKVFFGRQGILDYNKYEEVKASLVSQPDYRAEARIPLSDVIGTHNGGIHKEQGILVCKGG